MSEYPASFYVAGRWLHWTVHSDYEDGTFRLVCGPFWSRMTALRIAAALTQHYRNGFDTGRKKP
ncbi:MAG: hypothetical protein NUV51_04000 [Sulfuricaulis sp.]|nr:hypothetical protein [Sulfuricaulis sp.]